MIRFRQSSVPNRRMAAFALRLSAVMVILAGTTVAQGTSMSEPDDSKPVQITGCMTARTRTGGFVLSGVFGRPVTVIGPNYLQMGLGHQVTLTGTWQSNGIAPKNDKVIETRMFVASSVKITARQCASPPNANTSSSSSERPSGS